MIWSTASFVHLSILYASFSLLIRVELGVSGVYIFRDGMQNSFYRAVTAHGLGMVFLFIMPGLISAVGNLQVPQSLGLLDFATPRLNNLAFWSSVISIQILLTALASESGLSAGWTLYFPLTGADFSSSSAVSLGILSLHVLGLSSEAGAMTFMVSMQLAKNCGVPSLHWDLVVWTMFIVSVLLLTTLPVLGSGITVLFLERQMNFGVLAGTSTDSGGDPVAFQHLFWFFGHPEVYVIILPAFGMISWALEAVRGRNSLSHLGMTLAIWSIGIVGYFVWAHHMFTVGMSDISRLYFSAATLVIGVPTAVKIFAWTISLTDVGYRDINFLIATIFISCFVFGGFTGLILANAGIDLAYHDTYFVVGHFHYVLSIAAALGLLIFVLSMGASVLHAQIHFHNAVAFVILMVIGVNSLFLLQHLIGIEGHPRRVFLSPELYVGYAAFANTGFFAIMISLTTVHTALQSSAASAERKATSGARPLAV